MDLYCELHSKFNFDNDTLLLDDDNVSCDNCVVCRKTSNHWHNVSLNTDDYNWIEGENEKLHQSNTNASSQLVLINDDIVDTPEDSPLLINDDNKEYNTALNHSFHCHSNFPVQTDATAWKKLLSASFLCFIFMVAELVGGYIASSLAVMTDAAHLFSDFVGFLISLLSLWVGRWPANQAMTFGYHRAEVLGAFLSVLTVWLLAGIFSVLAIFRLLNNEYKIDANTMLTVSVFGLLINILMGAILHGACHTHSHTSSISKQKDENINVRAAAAHVIGDLLQSLGVLLAAIIIKVYPEAVSADPICTILFSIVVVCTTSTVAWDSIWLLLEASPKTYNSIAAELRSLTGVKHLHDLHIWTLAPGKDAVAAHLAVDEYCDKDCILNTATNLIKSQLNVISCTIQVETYNSELINSCKECHPL